MTMMQGRWLKYSDGFPVWIMRLVRNGRAEFTDCGHGEVAVPNVAGRILSVREPFLHFPFSKGLADWIDRHNHYSTREAQLELQGVQSIRWRQLVSPARAERRAAFRGLSRRVPCRPLLRLFYQYFWKRGFLDGRVGWQFSRLMAMYEGWIVAKTREGQDNQKKLESEIRSIEMPE